MVGARPLGGGSICHVWQAKLADASRVVVKQTPYAATIEADGLQALAAAGAPVPRVLGVSSDTLVLAHVTGQGSAQDWTTLGTAIAGLHRAAVTADLPAGAFGWPRDNLIGALPQDNTAAHDWPTFYAERRIRPMLTSGRATAGQCTAQTQGHPVPDALRRRLERALDGPLQRLLAHDARPSLVHGDLWSGNVVGGRWLIDPAVHLADREFELAFMHVFAGLPGALFAAYEEAWPLDADAGRRRPALQLYHLLVHVRLFGAGWAGSVASRLDALGW